MLNNVSGRPYMNLNHASSLNYFFCHHPSYNRSVPLFKIFIEKVSNYSTQSKSSISGFIEYNEKEQYMFAKWKDALTQAFRAHGFVDFSPRPVEEMQILRKKGGIAHQIYGINQAQEYPTDVRLGLPFDRTVPLAIWLNKFYKEIAFPYKRSDISYSFRGESSQTGRFRGFIQADVDIIDRQLDYKAELECVSTIYDGLSALDFQEFTLYLNHIEISKAIVKSLGVENEQLNAILRVLDKLDKLEFNEIKRQIIEIAPNASGLQVEEMIESFQFDGPIKEFEYRPTWEKNGEVHLNHLKKIFFYLEDQYGIKPEKLKYSPRIVRGLDYYTGIVFETFLKGKERYGSIASGGRYDKLVEGIGKNHVHFEGVGGSIGLTRLFDIFSKTDGKGLISRCSGADAVIFSREEGLENIASDIARRLRKLGKKIDLYTGCAKKIHEKLDYTNKKGIPFAIMVMAQNSIVVKNMSAHAQLDVNNLEDALSTFLEQSQPF